jgi:hypothetical protein
LAPIVCRPVDDTIVPDELARLHFIVFDDTHFDEKVDVLVEALSTDITWTRNHTELGVQAYRWSLASRAEKRGLLLRSAVLDDAERWIASRPLSAPKPTKTTELFISESRRAVKRRRFLLATGLVVAIMLASLAYWQRITANEQRSQAKQQADIAIKRTLESKKRHVESLVTEVDAGISNGDFATALEKALEAKDIEDTYLSADETRLSSGALLMS